MIKLIKNVSEGWKINGREDGKNHVTEDHRGRNKKSNRMAKEGKNAKHDHVNVY